MILIGLNGRLHSGKDTAVQYIETCARGLRVQRIAFADRMKLSFLRALGFDPQTPEESLVLANKIKDTGNISTTWIDGYKAQPVVGGGSVQHPVLKSRTISGRVAQQRYGTEAHRNVFGDDFWVDAHLPKRPAHTPYGTIQQAIDMLLANRYPDVDVLVETTVRFQNEAQRILDLGGQVWSIDADERLGPLTPDAHPSEHPLPSSLVTCTITNNTTLEQFEANIRTAWELSYGGITHANC